MPPRHQGTRALIETAASSVCLGVSEPLLVIGLTSRVYFRTLPVALRRGAAEPTARVPRRIDSADSFTVQLGA